VFESAYGVRLDFEALALFQLEEFNE